MTELANEQASAGAIHSFEIVVAKTKNPVLTVLDE